MNLYDFDETIYDGDASIDFFFYSMKKNKRVLSIIPKLILAVILYIFKVKDKEYLKSSFFSFIRFFDNLEEHVENFWDIHEHKIKKFYKDQKNDNDLIISASPEFLLNPIGKRLGFKVIGLKVDSKGTLIGYNTYGEGKVRRLKEDGITECDEFYSDSLSDTPCSKLARKSYIVKGETLIPWNKYKPSLLKRAINIFLSRDFFTFCLIGLINVINGIWIAYCYSLFISDQIFAYILGFLTSLVISYILNSLFNFKQKLSIKSFLKFAVNNIPNFIIQVLSVTVLLKTLELSKLISYGISAVIAVPITFVLVKINVFSKRK